MEGSIRREKILEVLKNTKAPISGGELAKKLNVSRQVIVQDIALLRATNKNILSTTKGYILYREDTKKSYRTYLVKHTNEEIEDELCTIVDSGGKVLDVIVSHEIYGQISADLIISNRQDVYDFVNNIKEKNTKPLKELTNGVHIHTVEADTEEILDNIEKKLIEKRYLIIN